MLIARNVAKNSSVFTVGFSKNREISETIAEVLEFSQTPEKLTVKRL